MTRLSSPSRTLGAIGLALLVTAAAPASAQQSRYSQWSDPSAPSADNRLQGFIDRLNKLIDEGEKARAADPNFLRDLRDLAGGFERPWRRQILSDAFIDGDYTRDPSWTVLSGKYWVERGWGLRSAVKPGAESNTTETQPATNEKKAAQLFGAILNQALGGGSQGSQGGTTQDAPAAAIIHAPTAITNAFALEMDFSSWSAEGQFQVALYQGRFQGDASPGYRLTYRPGGTLQIDRVSSRGTSVVERATKAMPLEDKKIHRIQWLRYADGRMSVSVNGTEVLTTADRGFRDAFSGLALINSGGDYIIKTVAVSGT